MERESGAQLHCMLNRDESVHDSNCAWIWKGAGVDGQRVDLIIEDMRQYMQYSGDWRCNTVSNQPTAVVVWLSPSFQFVSIDDEFHDSRTECDQCC